MPKFRVIAAETTYYRGIVEAESREALDEIGVEEMDLSEYDGTVMEIVQVKEL